MRELGVGLVNRAHFIFKNVLAPENLLGEGFPTGLYHLDLAFEHFSGSQCFLRQGKFCREF